MIFDRRLLTANLRLGCRPYTRWQIADRQSQFANHLLAGALALVLGGCADAAFPDITNGQGEMAGEVTATSVILQSRLTVGSELVEGDLPGAEGTARFEVAATSEFAVAFQSDWLLATPDNDFIVKTKITA
jgi:alkaline phosphatase/alkaline phosphatase D